MKIEKAYTFQLVSLLCRKGFIELIAPDSEYNMKWHD